MKQSRVIRKKNPIKIVPSELNIDGEIFAWNTKVLSQTLLFDLNKNRNWETLAMAFFLGRGLSLENAQKMSNLVVPPKTNLKAA